MTQEAYQRAFAACREYDSRWVVPEIKRNNLWLKAFHNSETLPNMVKDILSSANLERRPGVGFLVSLGNNGPFWANENMHIGLSPMR